MQVILFSLMLGGAICLEQAGDTVSYGKYDSHVNVSSLTYKELNTSESYYITIN